MSRRYQVGLDLGQSQDYTALAVCEEVPFITDTGRRETGLHVRHLDRFRHIPYPQQVERIERIMNSPALRHRSNLVIDGTGVGQPVVDMFRQKRRHNIKVVKIHGGDHEHRGEEGSYRVPKRDLIGGLQALLQSGHLKIADRLELAEVLKAELLNFKVKINVKTAHDSYEAWREGDHDDLVLAAALAAWGAGKTPALAGPTGPAVPAGSHWNNFGR